MLIAVISSLVSAASGFATAAVDSPAVASVQASTFVADSPVVAPRAVRAIRLARPPVIDGSLSDELWLDADRVTGFLQRDPDEGTQPTEGTVVHVVYDDAALYIGARMHDAHPDSIIARLGRRDALTNSDAFTVFIDPYHDRRSGYYFGVNAAGTLSDGTLYNDEWEDNSWDGVWEGNVTRDSLGWTAELRIPYSQLRFIHRPEYLWESTSSERSRARTSVPISSTRPRTVAASFHASSTWWGSAGHAAAAPRGAAVHHRQGGILAASGRRSVPRQLEAHTWPRRGRPIRARAQPYP